MTPGKGEIVKSKGTSREFKGTHSKEIAGFYEGKLTLVTAQPTPPPPITPPHHRNKGLIAGLSKGNQWFHKYKPWSKGRLFLGEGAWTRGLVDQSQPFLKGYVALEGRAP